MSCKIHFFIGIYYAVWGPGTGHGSDLDVTSCMPDTFAYVASFSKEEERRLLKGSGDGKQVTSVTPFSFLSSGTPERPSFTTEAGWELGGIEVTTATDTKAGRSQRESTRLPDSDFPWSHTAHRRRNAPACACAAARNSCARMQPSAARQRSAAATTTASRCPRS